jgi:hypothetical protein
VYRDTIITIHLPGEKITSPGDTVYIDRITKLPNSRRSTLNTSIASSWAQVVDGKLLHELQQKDTVLERIIANAIREHSTHTVKEVVREKVVYKVRWWQVPLMWIGAVALLLLAIRFAWAKIKPL